MAGLTASVRPDSFSLQPGGDDALNPSTLFSFFCLLEEDISTHQCAPRWRAGTPQRTPLRTLAISSLTSLSRLMCNYQMLLITW